MTLTPAQWATLAHDGDTSARWYLVERIERARANGAAVIIPPTTTPAERDDAAMAHWESN